VIPLSTADAPDPRLLGGVISIGNFDGVHRGHAQLIRQTCDLAEQIGGPAVAVTFDPSPGALLRPDSQPPALTTIQRRDELLRGCGVDGVVVIRTVPDLLTQSPETFFRRLVLGALQARGMVEGPNFFFGKGRAGNPRLLSRLCEQAEVACRIVEPTTESGMMISSTRVRALLIAGAVAEAAALLTQPYRLSGVVTSGAGRGRQLGFPTANLTALRTLVPGPGVYACRAGVGGKWHSAAVHIGPNPTFDEAQSKVEVHLLDFADDLYERTLDVDFISRIRGVETFGSGEELRSQVFEDLRGVRAALAR